MPPLVLTVDLGSTARAFVTGRDPEAVVALGAAGNLSHRRPHLPDDLARARAEVGERTGTDHTGWHLLRQVHGARVATVGPETPIGAELRDVDAAVTREPDRVLAVQTADCVPVLFAGPGAVGVAHAGRAGVVEGVAGATVRALAALGEPVAGLRASLGPAIGGCCYEVPPTMRDEVATVVASAHAVTSWGTPSLDLRAAVRDQLHAVGVTRVQQVGGCTRCDPEERWFSHRADPEAGRQLGLIVRARQDAA